ncbi:MULTISPECIES: TonB-dependent receptor [Acidiphilium]|uniref:Iron complex outermembrane recepter protein n=1 Tax=Acidiphilium rubrum TaxID=526 RepID=A0A8G2CPE7_ACIRU|nr:MULTISPECIES: TonB-dependent receptor [Acidiphilium]SIR42425.1 iron complex outermembrane recepter protein [Acidiphilium rubrum]
MAQHAHAKYHGKRTAFAVLLLSGTALAPVAAWAQAVNAGTVSANGSAYVPGATTAPTHKKLFKSGTTTRVLDRKIMDAAGPVGGAAQILSYSPGVTVTGYGNTGSAKYTITLDGVQQGWGGYGGFTGTGSIGVTLDGIPVVDPSTDLWQSNTIPQTGMIQSTQVTYGPGNPVNRWYNNIGGGVEYTPVQPTSKPGGDVNLTYGSYGQKNIEFDLRTGLYDGWSTVLAGGAGNGNSFRTAADGFKSPNENYSIYLKTVKQFSAGNIQFGGYFARSAGYRVPVIPTTPQAGVTITGNPGMAGSTLYSQQTSGYDSALPFNTYEKFDTNAMWLVFAKENIDLGDATTLHNLTWYENITRVHSRLNDLYNTGPNVSEYNSPHTNIFGDKLWLSKSFAMNTVDAGAYYIHDTYNSRNNFYNVFDGGNKGVVNIGGKIRSSYFTQDDFALFAQDDFHPIAALHITPGVRFVNFQTGYSNGSLQDFGFAPGVVLSTHCPLTGAKTKGNVTDQGASCGANESRSGVEPSLSANLQVLPWLALYGSYAESLRTPSVGGGGGLFQKVNPNSYHLELGQDFQGGAKFNVEDDGILHHFLAGISYFHLRYAKQSINYTLANGNEITASGSSIYKGVNMYFNDNPLYNLFVYGNASITNANYQTYVTGAGAANPGTSYSGSKVPYVPEKSFNVGAYYDYLYHNTLLEPRAWVQFTGTQNLFNNVNGAPSHQTMPSYGTFNLSFKVSAPIILPYAGKKSIDFKLTALNVTNNRYNEYEYISSGGYFGTSNGGYLLAYPGAPFTIYGSVGMHF